MHKLHRDSKKLTRAAERLEELGGEMTTAMVTAAMRLTKRGRPGQNPRQQRVGKT